MTNRIFISGDVEASGEVPGIFDLISVGMVVIEPTLTRTFYGEFAPLHDRYRPDAYRSIGVTREQHLAMPNPVHTTRDMIDWLDSLGQARLVFISDNPGFDFCFLVWYLVNFHDRNPLGHSSRRIGDFAAGIKRNFLEQQSWKKLRKTKHTHNALDDAMGNAEALVELFRRNNIRAPWDAA